MCVLLVQYKHRTKLSYRNLTLSGTGNHFSRGTDYMQAEQGGGLPDGLLYLQVSCIGHLSPPKCSPGKCSIPAAEIVSLILSQPLMGPRLSLTWVLQILPVCSWSRVCLCFGVCLFDLFPINVLDLCAATCCYFTSSFNRIDIPPYESYEKLYEKLLTAVEETCGFAVEWQSNQRKQMLAHGPPNQKLEEACCELPAKLSEASEL